MSHANFHKARSLALALAALSSFTSLSAQAGWLDGASKALDTVSATQATAQQAITQAKTVEAASIDPTASLVDLAQQQAGLNPQQAQGGLGVLFGLAQSRVAPAQFDQMAALVPEMPQLLGAAKDLPATPPATNNSLTGSLLGAAGALNPKLGAATQAYNNLSGLGLDAGTINTLINLVVGFFQAQPEGAGVQAATAFQQATAGVTAVR